MANNIHKYTVQEAANIAAQPRVIDVNCTTTAADYDIDDVIFNWTEVSNWSRNNGEACELLSAVCWLPAAFGDRNASIQLIFCRGTGDDGTAPTAGQALGALDGAVDITRAEAGLVKICGDLMIGGNQDDLILSSIASSPEHVGLIMAPAINSTSLYVAGVARKEPGAAFTDTTIPLYLGVRG